MSDAMSPQELLETSPYEDSLEEALAAHPPRAKLPMTTLVLGAGVVVVAGFLGGVYADKAWGGSDTSTTASGRTFPGAGQTGRNGNQTGRNGQSGYPGGGQNGFPQGGFPGNGSFPGGGQSGFPGGGGNLTTGTVEKVSGNTVAVKTSDGKTVEVRIGDQTTVTTSKKGGVKDIKSGMTIVVRGDQITVQPAQ